MSFFVVATLILLVMQVCLGLWLYFVCPALGWKIPAVVAPVLLTAFVRWAMVYTRTHYGTLESILYYLSYTWAGLVFILFSIVLAFALAQSLCHLLRIPARAVLGPISLAVMALAAGMAVWGGLKEPAIKHIYASIPGAPEMTAVLISDSHLGEGVSLARWQRVLERIAAQKPDMILVLGDLFEYGMHRKKYAQALADFQTAYGSFGVLGNHEYYMGYDNSVDFYRRAGITLLQNQIHTLPNGVQIIGINDIQTARVTAEALDKLLAQTNADAPRLLLSHQPKLVDTAARHQVPLMLSGHTHNGQIFPFNWLVKLHNPFVYGWYQTGPQSRLYVTSGMFYWGIPLRFLAPAEIPILHINSHD